MVAYSFNRRFVGWIRDGVKTQTIRAERKRHARVGEPLQLYYAMRTRHCFRIVPDVVCTEVLPVAISLARDEVVLNLGTFYEEGVESGKMLRFSASGLDLFARKDGFISWADMKAFFLSAHKEAFDRELVWEGALINWGMPYRDIAAEKIALQKERSA